MGLDEDNSDGNVNSGSGDNDDNNGIDDATDDCDCSVNSDWGGDSNCDDNYYDDGGGVVNDDLINEDVVKDDDNHDDGCWDLWENSALY